MHADEYRNPTTTLIRGSGRALHTEFARPAGDFAGCRGLREAVAPDSALRLILPQQHYVGPRDTLALAENHHQPRSHGIADCGDGDSDAGSNRLHQENDVAQQQPGAGKQADRFGELRKLFQDRSRDSVLFVQGLPGIRGRSDGDLRVRSACRIVAGVGSHANANSFPSASISGSNQTADRSFAPSRQNPISSTVLSLLNTQYSTLNTQHSTLNTQYSTLNTHHRFSVALRGKPSSRPARIGSPPCRTQPLRPRSSQIRHKP